MPSIGRRPSALGRRRRSEASNPGKEPNIVVRQTGLWLKCPRSSSRATVGAVPSAEKDHRVLLPLWRLNLVRAARQVYTDRGPDAPVLMTDAQGAGRAQGGGR